MKEKHISESENIVRERERERVRIVDTKTADLK